MTTWNRKGFVTYSVTDITWTFDPSTGALFPMSSDDTKPHPNSPQRLYLSLSNETRGSYFNHIYTSALNNYEIDPRNSLWVQEHLKDGTITIGELGDSKQKHHPPLPYTRKGGPVKLDGTSEVWRYHQDGTCFQHVADFPWSHFILTQHLGPNPSWGPWPNCEYFALQERTYDAPDVVYNYVTAEVSIAGRTERRLVNFWYGVEPLDGSGKWVGHQYHAIDFG